MEEMENKYGTLPENKGDLLARIQREWDTLLSVIGQITMEQMAVPGEGGWSIKDNLAHLAAWERFMHQHYLGDVPAHEAMGFEEGIYQALDEDGQNAILFERNRQRSSQEILAEFHQTHEQAMDVLEQMPFADLLKPRVAKDPESGAVLNWVVGNTYEHFLEHRYTIEGMLERFEQENL